MSLRIGALPVLAAPVLPAPSAAQADPRSTDAVSRLIDPDAVP